MKGEVPYLNAKAHSTDSNQSHQAESADSNQTVYFVALLTSNIGCKKNVQHKNTEKQAQKMDCRRIKKRSISSYGFGVVPAISLARAASSATFDARKSPDITCNLLRISESREFIGSSELVISDGG